MCPHTWQNLPHNNTGQALSNEVSAHHRRQCQNYWDTTETICWSSLELLEALATRNQPEKYPSPTVKSGLTRANFRKKDRTGASLTYKHTYQISNQIFISISGCISISGKSVYLFLAVLFIPLFYQFGQRQPKNFSFLIRPRNDSLPLFLPSWVKNKGAPCKGIGVNSTVLRIEPIGFHEMMHIEEAIIQPVRVSHFVIIW